MRQQIDLALNGETHELLVETHHTLLEVMSEHLGLTGARNACGIGICGACTVLMDGEPVSSCLLLTGQVQGREITTIEGIGTNGALDPVQQAFIDCMGFQCSFCTPGLILAARALLAENDDPTRREVRAYLAGNLCRCGSYVKIEDAVLEAARVLRAARVDGGC